MHLRNQQIDNLFFHCMSFFKMDHSQLYNFLIVSRNVNDHWIQTQVSEATILSTVLLRFTQNQLKI